MDEVRHHKSQIKCNGNDKNNTKGYYEFFKELFANYFKPITNAFNFYQHTITAKYILSKRFYYLNSNIHQLKNSLVLFILLLCNSDLLLGAVHGNLPARFSLSIFLSTSTR